MWDLDEGRLLELTMSLVDNIVQEVLCIKHLNGVNEKLFTPFKFPKGETGIFYDIIYVFTWVQWRAATISNKAKFAGDLKYPSEFALRNPGIQTIYT